MLPGRPSAWHLKKLEHGVLPFADRAPCFVKRRLVYQIEPAFNALRGADRPQNIEDQVGPPIAHLPVPAMIGASDRDRTGDIQIHNLAL